MKAQHLVVLRSSALGDVAMLVPVLRALFAQYPKVKVTLILPAWMFPIFSEFERIHLLPFYPKGKHKGLRGLFRLYRAIKQLKPSAIVDLHVVLRTHILRLYFLCSFLPFYRMDKGRKEKRALTRKKNKEFRPLCHTVERYGLVFEQAGFPLDLSKNSPPSRPALTSKMSSLVQDISKPRVGIAPFASFSGKMYPLDLMEQVVASLSLRCQLYFFGAGQNEISLLNEWEKKYPNCFSLAGNYSLSDELSFMAHLDLMVAMDSGNAHLANNAGCSVVTLWGMTHPYAGFAPWGQPKEHQLLLDREQFPLLPTSIYGNNTPKGYEHAFRELSPTTVIDKIESLLGRISR